MRKNSKKNAGKGKRLDPMIVVALIGLAGTIIAALLASPLLERFFVPSQTATPVQVSNTTTNAQPSQVNTPVEASNATTGAQIVSKPISLNQTVTGTLYGAEAGRCPYTATALDYRVPHNLLNFMFEFQATNLCKKFGY